MARRDRERRRGKRRENRHERRQEQHAGGGEWDCISLPEGMDVFKPEKSKTYHIDVIPYIVGGHNKAADKGDEYFELSYPVYRDLGIDEKKYIAIGEFCGKRDPVAEHFAQLRKDGAEWDDMKIFKPTWRQLMLFFVHEEAEKGLQLYEGAYGTFGELLDEELKANEDDYIDNFDDPDGGATLVVRFKAKSIGQTNPWILASKINFEERDGGFDADGDKKLAAEVLEKADGICLDDLLKIADYDTLKKALDGEPMGGDEGGDETPAEEPTGRRTRKPKEPEAEVPEEPEAEPPAKKSKKKKAAPTAASLGIVKGGEVEHDDHGPCTVIRIAKDGLTISLMDESDEVHKDVDPTDVEPIVEGNAEGEAAPDALPDPAEDPPPKDATGTAKSASTSTSPSNKDDDWDDDWDEDDKKD